MKIFKTVLNYNFLKLRNTISYKNGQFSLGNTGWSTTVDLESTRSWVTYPENLRCGLFLTGTRSDFF